MRTRFLTRPSRPVYLANRVPLEKESLQSVAVLQTLFVLHAKQDTSVLVALVSVRHAKLVISALLDHPPHDRAQKAVSAAAALRLQGVRWFGVPRRFHVRPARTARSVPQLQ